MHYTAKIAQGFGRGRLLTRSLQFQHGSFDVYLNFGEELRPQRQRAWKVQFVISACWIIKGFCGLDSNECKGKRVNEVNECYRSMIIWCPPSILYKTVQDFQ